MHEIKLNAMPSPYGVELINVDLNSCSKSDLNDIGKILLQKLLVVIKKQKISTRKFATICYSWGKPFIIPLPEDNDFLKEINRVCLTRLPGVIKIDIDSFLPDGELDWHSDKSSDDHPNDVIALYAMSVSEGSCTDFLEGVTPYQLLSNSDRLLLDSLHCVPSFNSTYFPSSYSDDQKKIIQYAVESQDMSTCFPLVRSNAAGYKGILYNRHMFKQFAGKSVQETEDLCKWIESFLYKQENIYRHYWNDGDFLIMDQTLLLHRRPQQDCSRRQLIRMMFDTSKIIS